MEGIPAAVGNARPASSFVHDKAYIDGQWVSAEDGATFEGNAHCEVPLSP